MYVRSRHARNVSRLSLLRALVYAYINPRSGFYAKLKTRFGTHTLLMLNSEIAVGSVIKNIQDKEPGRVVLIETSLYKRFSKVVLRGGLKAAEYSGEKQLIEYMKELNPLLIIVPDHYRTSSPKLLKRLSTTPTEIMLYQNTPKPRQTDVPHTIYLWEPKNLPRTSGGAVVVILGDGLADTYQKIRTQNLQYPRLSTREFIQEIIRAIRGFENKYRRLDRRPSRVLARMLYDFYK